MDKFPNILWICSDQQRYDTLRCYGNKFVDTPNLDNLAQNGVLFEYAFTQSPVCTPSRACFLTGRYPRTTRTRQNGQSIPEDEVVFPRVLKERGYICGLSGKLHLSPCQPSACPGTERRIKDGYDIFHWSHHPNPDWPTNEYILWLHEKGIEYKTTAYSECSYVKRGMPEEYHQTTWCVEKAINFIKEARRHGKPWLFSINMFDPHDPYDPPEELLEKYKKIIDDIPLPNYEEELKSKSLFQQLDHKGAYNTSNGYSPLRMTSKDQRWITAAYWAMCELIDKQVGRLINLLKDIGELENTIIIYHSDHGEMLGDHGIYLKGPHFYEPGVRIPLIISWPKKIVKGKRAKSLVELVDLVPTLSELIGIEPPIGIQGKSFAPILLKKDKDIHRDNVYCEYYNALTSHRAPLSYGTMIRTQRYKLIVYHTIDFGELYDLEKDPNERYNLWNDSSYIEIKLKLLKLMTDRMAFTVDPLPIRESGW